MAIVNDEANSDLMLHRCGEGVLMVCAHQARIIKVKVMGYCVVGGKYCFCQPNTSETPDVGSPRA